MNQETGIVIKLSPETECPELGFMPVVAIFGNEQIFAKHPYELLSVYIVCGSFFDDSTSICNRIKNS